MDPVDIAASDPVPARAAFTRGLWRGIVAALAALGAVYLLALAGLWWGQERLIFPGGRLAPVPADAPPAAPAWPADVQELFIERGGARLHALYLHVPQPRGLVFFLHGNAGTLEDWFVDLDFWRRSGFELFMLDYRGFGRSSGTITSQAELEADVRAAWQRAAHLAADRPVVVVGRSLGTALAAGLAAALPPGQRPALLVLASPYRSMVQLMREKYPWAPTALLRYPLHTDTALARLASQPAATRPPVLLLHGERDAFIPLAHSQALLQTAPDARLVRVPGAGHADLHQFPIYRQALGGALAAAGRPDPGPHAVGVQPAAVTPRLQGL